MLTPFFLPATKTRKAQFIVLHTKVHPLKVLKMRFLIDFYIRHSVSNNRFQLMSDKLFGCHLV